MSSRKLFDYGLKDSDIALIDSMNLSLTRGNGEQIALISLGASDHLAKKKGFTVLFSLYYHDFFPMKLIMLCFDCSYISDAKLHGIILATISCIMINGKTFHFPNAEKLWRCLYHDASTIHNSKLKTLPPMPAHVY